MLTEQAKKRLEDRLYNILKESLSESDFFGDEFMPYEAKKEDSESKDSKESKSEKGSGDETLKLSDYNEYEEDAYGKMKAIIPVLTSTYDNEVNTYNLTHSQLAYVMYPDLDPDTARSKFSQKVTAKKRFTAKEINKLFNIISGKIA